MIYSHYFINRHTFVNYQSTIFILSNSLYTFIKDQAGCYVFIIIIFIITGRYGHYIIIYNSI